MLDIASLITQNGNGSKNVHIQLDPQKKAVVFEISNSVFNGDAICKVLKFADMVCKGRNIFPGQPILFNFTKKNFKFPDKMSYILMECICYRLIQCHHPCYLYIRPEVQIDTHGYDSSLLKLLTSYGGDHIRKFCDQFRRDLYNKHYRTVLPCTAKGTKELSILMDEIAYYLELSPISKESQERVAEVLTELVGNAIEHTESDCLIDIDISGEYIKPGVDGKIYLGINIVILDLAQELLGSALKRKICGEKNVELNDRYKIVQQAYQNHRRFFNANYQEEDFFNLATFQHKISGRPDVLTGGTGLTKLIQSLEEDSDAYKCYVISGNRRIAFINEFLRYNDDNWIGFNAHNDFLNEPPEPNIISPNPFFFPGTGYNLTFIVEVPDDAK